MLKQRATQEIKVVARDRTYTSDELLRLLAKNPKKASSVAASVTAISADPAIIRGVGSTALGGLSGRRRRSRDICAHRLWKRRSS